MASITSDIFSFPSIDYCEILPPTITENVTMWNAESNFPSFRDQGTAAFQVMPGEADDETLSSMLGMSFAQRFEFPLVDIAHQPFMPESEIGYCKNIAHLQNLGSHHEFQQPESETAKFPTSLEFHPTSRGSDAWGCQGNVLTSLEETNTKVRRYTEEERRERIHRYLKKKNQRNFNKTIKYACRKTLADRRIRVRGRFARNNELSQEPTTTKNNEISQYEEYYEDNPELQVKLNGEEWLEEAVKSLMYLPIFAG